MQDLLPAGLFTSFIKLTTLDVFSAEQQKDEVNTTGTGNKKA